jgi:alpha-galactosidase
MQVLLNAAMLAVHQDPLGQPGDRRGYASDAGCGATSCQLWSRNLANGDVAAVLYNRGDAPVATMTFPFELLGGSWGPATVARGYNLWEHAPVAGNLTGHFSAAVPAHGVVALRLTPLA